MPKLIDHEARRLELSDALLRVVRRHGWEAVSLRKVATEAGVSMGMVQHYFTTKDEMLRFVLEVISDDVRARCRARVAALPEPHTPRRVVGAVLTEMIPRRSRRETEVDAAAVFVRRFMLRPESVARLAASGADLKAFLADQIRIARAPGGTVAEAERDAGGLIALLDGLMLSIISGQQTYETSVEIMETQVDLVLGTEPRSPSEPLG